MSVLMFGNLMMDGQILIALLVAVLLSVALGAALGRYAFPSRLIDATALAQLQHDVARHQREGDELRERTRALSTERLQIEDRARLSEQECATLKERVTNFEKTIAGHIQRIQDTDSAHGALVQQARDAAATIAASAEREKGLAQKVESQMAQLNELQIKLTGEFENIATRILKSNSSQLSEASNQSLAALLDPLKEKIGDFQRKVEQTYETEQREVISLKEQIRSAIETSQNVGRQADDLAKALRGKSQQLGRWGELVLERVLEDAGLHEGREYVTQGRGLQLKDDDGGAVRPDVIVNLPEGRSLIIDSKVPLAAYERLVTTEDEDERALSRQQFLRDVRGHIDDLAGKRYQDNARLQAHEFAMLFMPVESSLYEALTGDAGLFAYAWNKSVVLVGPSTLLATMRTVASIWRHEKQAENAQKIAKDAGLLLDKLSNSIEDLNRVGAKLSEASDWHNKAMGRLFTGKGNALSIGKRIRDAGVRSKQVMASPVVDGMLVASAAYDDENEVEAEETSGPDEDPTFADDLLDDRALVSETN